MHNMRNICVYIKQLTKMETNHLIQAKNSGCGLEVGKPFYVASICHVKGQSKRKNFLVHVEALLQYSYTCIIH